MTSRIDRIAVIGVVLQPQSPVAEPVTADDH